MKIYLITTEHCPKCKVLYPLWEEFKTEHTDIEFKEIVFGLNAEDDKFCYENRIQSAPAIVIDNGEVKGLYYVYSKKDLETAYETYTKRK